MALAHTHTHKAHPAHIALKSGPTKPDTLNPAPALRRCCPLTQNQFLTTSLQPAVCECSAMLAAHAHTHVLTSRA